MWILCSRRRQLGIVNVRTLVVVLLVVFLVLALAGAPGFGPWHHDYGYLPSGGFGFAFVLLLLLLLLGVI